MFPKKLRLAAYVLTIPALFSATPDLEHRIDALVDATGPVSHGFVGIHVVELTGGKTIYQRNQDKLFMPASNMKLFTTALALTRLGPDYRIHHAGGAAVLRATPCWWAVAILRCVGACSRIAKVRRPSRALPPSKTSPTRMVSNAIVFGEWRYRRRRDRLYPWLRMLRALDAGRCRTRVRRAGQRAHVERQHDCHHHSRGPTAGDDAEITVDPAIEYYAIDNRLATVGRGEPKIRTSCAAGSRQVLLWGSIPAGVAVYETVAIDDPAYYAACALYDALARRGVAIRGRARRAASARVGGLRSSRLAQC